MVDSTNDNIVKVVTRFNKDRIEQYEAFNLNDHREQHAKHVMELRDQGVREALVAMGWTPPVDNTLPPVVAGRHDSDKNFLRFIHDRLEHVHGENKNFDYMWKLRNIIHEMYEHQYTSNIVGKKSDS